jgi:hypothetical protein
MSGDVVSMAVQDLDVQDLDVRKQACRDARNLGRST